MMKKLSLLFAAFVLGAVISLAIQACGNDKVDTGCSSSGSSSDTSCNSVWDNPKYASYITYDENGLESNRFDYEYDDVGRLISAKQTLYSQNLSGKKYLYIEFETNYTYADSDNIRYGTVTQVYYDENGTITNQTKTTEKVILYKQ